MVVFLLNGIIFILIGLQLPAVVGGLRSESWFALLLHAAAVSATVVLTRILWVFPATYLPRLISKRIRARDPHPAWQPVAIIAWSGMRGVVSLAAALALPLSTAAGAPFPGRNEIIFLSFCVILVTLVFQGLTLPLLVRALGIANDGVDLIAKSALPARKQTKRPSLSSRRWLTSAATTPIALSGCGTNIATGSRSSNIAAS